VLTVGGWFDTEDLYGPLHIYAAVERRTPASPTCSSWARGATAAGRGPTGERLGDITFASKTSEHYQQHIELPFFEHHLKDAPAHGLPEASVFETGVNRWRGFPQWPPPTRPRALYFGAGETLVDALPERQGRGLRRVHQRPEQAGARDPGHPSACPRST
jgi:predicted acyl esterase